MSALDDRQDNEKLSHKKFEIQMNAEKKQKRADYLGKMIDNGKKVFNKIDKL